MAKEVVDENKSTNCLLEDYLEESPLKVSSSNSEDMLGVGENYLFKQPQSMFDIEKETAEEEPDAEKDKEDEENQDEEINGVKESINDDSVVSEMKNLQIPQKLEIVIDPWKMDGKGQIYSEKYVIRNEGNTAGTLTLSNLACKSQEPGKVIVKSDNCGLHDNEDKALYMEMWFGNDNPIVLSEQGTEYQAVLQPGEELTVCFAGEVNEYAAENWKNDDVRVSVVYSWDTEEPVESESVGDKSVTESEENGEKEISRDSAKDTGIDDNPVKVEEPEGLEENEEVEENIGREEGEAQGKDEQSEANERNEGQGNPGEVGENKVSGEDSSKNAELKEPAGDAIYSEGNSQWEELVSGGENIFYIDEEAQISSGTEQGETGEDRTKAIELSEGQEMKAIVDFWKVEPDYQITSAQYRIRNVGERAGIFSLTDLVCQPKEECGINVKTIREEVQDTDEKVIYMELVLGNGEKFVLTQTGSECKVELRPGEDMIIQFVGVMNVDMYENWKEDSVVIRAGCSWETEK